MIKMRQELNTYLFGLDKINGNFDLAGYSFQHTTVLNEDKSIDLISTTENKATFMSRGLKNSLFEKAFKSIEPKRQDEEIRICKIPALNLEALWVHSESNADNDAFFPIYQFGIGNNETIQKKYSKRDFVQLVQQLAERVQHTDDDLLGS